MKTEFGNDTFELNRGYTVGSYLDQIEEGVAEAAAAEGDYDAEEDYDAYDDDAAPEAYDDMADDVDDVDDVMDSDYNPFDDEATARPSVMGYLLGREAKGSARAKTMRAYRTGALKKPSRKAAVKRRKKASPFAGFLAMSGVEKLTLILGILTVIAAVSVGTIYVNATGAQRHIEDFAGIGSEVRGIESLGGQGLIAVSDAQLAKQLAAEEALLAAAAAASAEQAAAEEEEEKNNTVSVIMTLTTVQSDLKIKFINYDTNRRVSGVPFEVLITNPSGDEKIYDDHDKDGIIYLKELSSGTYKVRMRALPLDYAQYAISTETLSIKIKETIEYKGIDIVDEIKTEAEVNVAKEDHKKEEPPVESENKNTVEWVESTKKEVDAGTHNAVTEGNTEYKRIEKSAIVDPFAVARMESTFIKLAGRRVRSESNASQNAAEGGNSASGESQNPSTGAIGSENTSGETSNPVTTESTTSATESTTSAAESTTSAAESTTSAAESTTAATAATTAPVQYRISLNEAAVSLENGRSTEVGVSFSPAGGSPSPAVSHADAGIATAELVEGNSKIRITARGAGSTTVQVTYAGERATIQVTVREVVTAAIYVTPDSAALKLSESITLGASLEGVEDKSVLWSVTSGNDIVRVDENGKVTALKEGKATVRGTSKENTDLFDETQITVTVDAEKMKATLKDREGRDVYVKEGSSYRLATGADYTKTEEFYVLAATEKAFVYTGWQTLDGKTYYFDKDGNKVTGEQVINGAKYSFGSDGVLSSASGNLGIDVSKWNGNIDWAAVKNSGVSYVIIRCGYRGMDTGALIEDPRFRQNIQGATSAGLKVGVYFFSQAINEVEAVEEASMAISLCRSYRLTYPIFLDVESGGRANGIGVDMRTKVCKAFCATVANAGYKAGIYANKTWFNSYINTPELTGYKLWLAQYASAPTYTRTRYDMWQYSSKGRISGISGNVDMNISYLGY